MTSRRLPQTGVTRSAWFGRGAGGWECSAPSPSPPHHCQAMPWTHQDGYWTREWHQTLIIKHAQDAEPVPTVMSEAASPGSGAGEVYEG